MIARACRGGPRRGRARRGVAAVEFAATFPLLMGLLLATLEFGNYFAQLALVSSVAYDAVRVAGGERNEPRAIISAEETAQTLLFDVGYDCATGCGIRGNAYPEGGVLLIELEMAVPYEQLTGILPEGSGLFAVMGFDAPNTLHARAIMPIVGP